MTFSFRSGLRFCSCGFDISNYRDTAKICLGCRRKASPEKTCKDCGKRFQELHASRCNPCRSARYIYMRFASGQYLAGLEVAKARAKKLLAPPTDFDCVDCGVGATEYDHRDYDSPLDVQPVCRKCNARRGLAKRKKWTFDEFWSWFSSAFSERMGEGAAPLWLVKYADFKPVINQFWPEPDRLPYTTPNGEKLRESQAPLGRQVPDASKDMT